MTSSSVLPRTAPEQQGISSTSILRFVEALEQRVESIHSFMLLRHGAVVAEGWWSPYAADAPHMLYSLSKSFTSTAVGFAVAEGLLTLDAAVVSFFPDIAPAAPDENLAAMQVRHLLSMSTGHADDTWLPMVMHNDNQWVKAFLAQPVQHSPGTHFLYNTGASYVLSAIVQRVAGMTIFDYLQPRLFAPLGIENPDWLISPEGITIGGFGMRLRTEDIAHFGQLYLQRGQWQGRQLLPAAWVAEATAFQVANGTAPDSDWAQGYGYQFWRCRHDAYRADGAFGQYCIVFPDHDAVLAITSGLDDMQVPLNIVWEMLLAAFAATALPDDSAAHAALSEKLATLNLAPVAGEAETGVSAQVSGHTYTAEANPLGIETVRVDFTATGSTVTVKQAHGDETFPCGFGTWQTGTTTVFNIDVVFGETTVASSGAWTANDTYTLVVRLLNTPYVYTLGMVFADNQLLINVQINVSFQSTNPITITAQRT